MTGQRIGSAEFVLVVDERGFVVGLSRAEAQAKRGSAKIAEGIEGNLKRAERSAGAFGAGFSKALQIGGAVTGVSVGLEAVSAALTKVAEQSQRTAQAQFALTKVFGESSSQYRAFAAEQAKVTGRSATDFELASVKAATLAKNYGLTSAQIQELLKRSADLAAVHGKELPDAAERVIAAIRGEAEAAEALGLTLNSDAVKAFAAMTDEQRRNFESLDQVSKAQIIYRELLRQTNDVQGAAAERANTTLGAFDRLAATTDKLAATIGTALAPGLGQLAGGFATAIGGATALAEQVLRLQQLGEGDGLRRLAAIMQALAGNPGALAAQLTGGGLRPAPAPDPNAGPIVGPSPDEVRAAQSVADADRKRRTKEQLEEGKKASERRAEFEIDAIRREKEAADKAFDERRALLQRRRDAEIKAAEDARDGAIKAIEAQAQATADAYDQEIIASQKARDALLADAEERRDGALAAIDAERQAVADATDDQIRRSEIERDRRRQNAEDVRDATIRALDEERRSRDDARRSEDRAREDETRDILRAIDARHDAEMRALDAEQDAAERQRDRAIRAIARRADKARDAHEQRMRQLDEEQERVERVRDAALRAIDEQADREAERHRAAMDALAEEEDARLAAIDAQLGALDALDQADRNADRDRQLADALTNAETDLKRAESTGNQSEIIRAQQALADAQDAIRDEQAKRERDAQRARLRGEQDAIRDEIAARRKAEEESARLRERELEASRRAAQDAANAAIAGLRERGEAERRSLDDTLRSLDRRKTAAQEAAAREIEAIRKRADAAKAAHDAELTRVRDGLENAKRAIDDRRRAEDQADQDRRRQVSDTYELEQRQIRATYDDEETGVIPALRRARETADREFQARRDAVQGAYNAERDEVARTYDDPEAGVLAKLRQQAEAAKREYDARKAATNDAYQSERDRIAEVYDDPERGLFAQLEKSKNATREALDAQIQRWQDWKRDVVAQIDEALSKLDEFIRRAGDINVDGPDGFNNEGGVGSSPYGPRQPPRGRGGDLAYGPVVRNASPESYWTSGGTHGGHPAADIFAPAGSPIYAPVSGRLSSYYVSDGGNAATLVGDDGRAYYFAHGQSAFESGQVTRGDQIGQVGNSGNARMTAPHLHFAIASSAGKFAELNGSGDISGDSSYWGSGGVAGRPGADDDEIEIVVLGRRIRVRRPPANVPGDVGRWLREAIAAAEAPRDWLLPLAQMAAAESGRRNGDGSVQVGTGNPRARNPNDVNGEHATGLMQTLPSTFSAHAVPGLDDIYNPVHNAAAAIRYIKRRYGDPRSTPYFRTGAFDWRGVEGYANGTLIREPTLMLGLRTGRTGVAGETGQPERLLGVDATRSYGGDDGVYLDFRGAAIYDGRAFKDRVIEALREARFSGQVRRDIFG